MQYLKEHMITEEPLYLGQGDAMAIAQAAYEHHIPLPLRGLPGSSKTEDYNDYRGEYAIEDTRHALVEAKAKGIHPFCITIDKQALDYIGHMYGEVNYIFVDEVRKLPIRLPEIYRVLTT